jgi:hypothetical protein
VQQILPEKKLQTFPVFSFKTNHRLLHPLDFALFFDKKPANYMQTAH